MTLKSILGKLFVNDKQIVVLDDTAENGGIESGSNANGNWTKFPDGTLIMTGTVTLAQQNTYTHVADAVWTHPITALSGGVVTGVFSTAAPSGSDARDYGIQRVAPYEVTSYVSILSSSSRDLSSLWGLDYALQFIGRWK